MDDLGAAQASGYTKDEIILLHQLAESYGISGDHIINMIREEMSYHDMGRRRGLFPSLLQIVADMAEGR